MSNSHDDFLAAFDKYLDEVGITDALSTATSIFVSLVVSYTEHMGHDSSKPITINGDVNRDVTIHPPKPNSQKDSTA